MQPSWRSNRSADIDTRPRYLEKLSSPASFLQSLTPEDCHRQEQSPLFGRLPAELRNAIFEHAISPYEDLARPFDTSSKLWRPGFRGPIVVDLRLLQVCRLAYYETNALALKNVELHCFASTSIAPEKARSYGVTAAELRPLVRRINRMSPRQKMQIKSLHLHPHSFSWTASSSLRFMFEFDLPIKRVTMSFGSTIWKDWEISSPEVAQLSDPLTNYKLPNTLEEFVLTFDTQEQWKPQLEAVLTAAGRWKRALQNGTLLLLDEKPKPLLHSWKGKAKSSARLRNQPPRTVMFCTGTVTWRRSRPI
jgi:hypothetical protein